MKQNFLFKTVAMGALLVFSLSSQAQSLSGQQLPTCNDGGEWPPYFYYERENGEATNRLVGYDLDFLNEVFEGRDIAYSFELIAWSRCLVEVEKGEKYAMLTSAAYSKERDEKYLLTDSYYTVQPHYFYSVASFPGGLEINSLEEFNDYRVCGLRGYNYTNFGVNVDAIDTGTKNFNQLIEKTVRKRCDVFLGRFEIFTGFAKTGNDYMKLNNLASAPMPGVPGDKFFMMVSRNHPNSQELLTILNEGIRELKASGRDKALMSPYLEN